MTNQNKKTQAPSSRVSRFADDYALVGVACMIFAVMFLVRLKLMYGYRTLASPDPTKPLLNFFTYYRLWAVTVLSIALAIYVGVRYLRGRRQPLQLMLPVLVLIIIGSAAIATALTSQPHVAWFGFYYRTNGLWAYISLFAMLTLVGQLRISTYGLDFFLRTIGLGFVILVTIGFFDFIGHSLLETKFFKVFCIPSSLLHRLDITHGIDPDTAASLTGHFNYFGAFSCLMTTLFYALFLQERRSGAYLFYGVVATCGVAGVFMANSMGAWISLWFGIGMASLLLLDRTSLRRWVWMGMSMMGIITLLAWRSEKLWIETLKFAHRLPRTGLIIVALIMLLLCCIVFLIRANTVNIPLKKGRLAALLFSAGLGAILLVNYLLIFRVSVRQPELFTQRGYVWKYAGPMALETPWFGCGPDVFYYKFPQINPDFNAMEHRQIFDKPHNILLQTHADTGAAGLLAFIALIYWLGIKASRSFHRNAPQPEAHLINALPPVLLTYLLQGVVNDNHIAVQAPLYALFGVGFAVLANKISPDTEHRTAVRDRPTRTAGAICPRNGK